VAAIRAVIERLVTAFAPVSRARGFIHGGLHSIPLRRGGESQLLVDVSVVLQNDARTGIQRVVRAILNQLLKHPPIGYKVCPIFAVRNHPYRYAIVHPDKPSNGDLLTEGDDVVCAECGDIFLGLDLAAHLLPARQSELLGWKRQGARLHFIVYDILPVRNQQWFNPKMTRNFKRWLRILAIFADSLICISNVVKEDVAAWLSNRYGFNADVIPISTIPLGADISASLPSEGLPDGIDQLLEKLREDPGVMMVGTLEPRKGHAQILAAFEELWRIGRNVNLVFIGKPGWKTEVLQRQLIAHPEAGRLLHWLESASDELLELLYTAVTGVIVASQAEGFGLSLVEAVYHGKPVLARDIPVFREVGAGQVSFFSGNSAANVAESINKWLNEISDGKAPIPSRPLQTWHDSAQHLLSCLGLSSSRSKRQELGLLSAS